MQVADYAKIAIVTLLLSISNPHRNSFSQSITRKRPILKGIQRSLIDRFSGFSYCNYWLFGTLRNRFDDGTYLGFGGIWIDPQYWKMASARLFMSLLLFEVGAILYNFDYFMTHPSAFIDVVITLLVGSVLFILHSCSLEDLVGDSYLYYSLGSYITTYIIHKWSLSYLGFSPRVRRPIAIRLANDLRVHAYFCLVYLACVCSVYYPETTTTTSRFLSLFSSSTGKRAYAWWGLSVDYGQSAVALMVGTLLLGDGFGLAGCVTGAIFFHFFPPFKVAVA